MHSVFTILANVVLGTVVLWFLVLLLLPKSSIDITKEKASLPTVMEHFLTVVSKAYYARNEGSYWKSLSITDQRSHAATEHRYYLRGQSMLTKMYYVYAVCSITVQFGTVLRAYSQNTQWLYLVLLVVLSVPVWLWQIAYSRAAERRNTDLERRIEVHTKSEYLFLKLRALYLVATCLVFIFA